MIKQQAFGFYNTPPLWENRQFDIQQFEFPKLNLQSFQPTAIPTNLRLGHQMEQVFQQLVGLSEAYDIILQNLQIGSRKKTLGEIDFILRDNSSDRMIHVELTYKFYLINPEIPTLIHQVIGPNTRDTFFEKKEKIKHIQFPLLHSKIGANALAEHHINHLEIAHQCCFKAQLFLPHDNADTSIGSLNRDSVVGYWLRMKDFDNHKFKQSQFYIPIKSEWVIEPHVDVLWQSYDEIMSPVLLSLKNQFAPMLWLKNADSQFEKIFLVWW